MYIGGALAALGRLGQHAPRIRPRLSCLDPRSVSPSQPHRSQLALLPFNVTSTTALAALHRRRARRRVGAAGAQRFVSHPRFARMRPIAALNLAAAVTRICPWSLGAISSSRLPPPAAIARLDDHVTQQASIDSLSARAPLRRPEWPIRLVSQRSTCNVAAESARIVNNPRAPYILTIPYIWRILCTSFLPRLLAACFNTTGLVFRPTAWRRGFSSRCASGQEGVPSVRRMAMLLPSHQHVSFPHLSVCPIFHCSEPPLACEAPELPLWPGLPLSFSREIPRYTCYPTTSSITRLSIR